MRLLGRGRRWRSRPSWATPSTTSRESRASASRPRRTLIRKYGTADAVIAHAEELTPKLRESVRAFARQSRSEPEARHPGAYGAGRLRPRGMPREAASRSNACARSSRSSSFRRLLEQLDGSRRRARPERRAAPNGGRPMRPHPRRAARARAARRAPRPARDLTETPERRVRARRHEPAFEEFLGSARAGRRPSRSTPRRPPSGLATAELVGLSFSGSRGGALPVRSGRAAGRTLDPGRTLARLAADPRGPARQEGRAQPEVRPPGAPHGRHRAPGGRVRHHGRLLPPAARGAKHGMDALARDVLGPQTIPITDLIGKGKAQTAHARRGHASARGHAGEDADITWRLHEALAPRLEGSPMRSLYPRRGAAARRSARGHGVGGDQDRLRAPPAISAEHGPADRDELEVEIYGAAGREFLIDSPKQLGEVLFDEQKLRSVRKTKTSRSTDADVLETLAVETAHPLPRLILEYRELAKLSGTYVDPLPAPGLAEDGPAPRELPSDGRRDGTASSSDRTSRTSPSGRSRGARSGRPSSPAIAPTSS